MLDALTQYYSMRVLLNVGITQCGYYSMRVLLNAGITQHRYYSMQVLLNMGITQLLQTYELKLGIQVNTKVDYI